MAQYTNKRKEEIFNQICLEVSEGEAVRNVLKQEGMPSSKTFYAWMQIKPKDKPDTQEVKENRVKQYQDATDERASHIFEEILKIADDQEGDVYYNDEGKECTNHNVISRSKVRIDARKWMLSKLNPKKYGDKIDHTTGGEKITTQEPVQIVFKDKK